MRQPEIIKINGKEIVYLNFSGLKKKDEVLEHINIFGSYIRKQQLNSLYTITNLSDMYFNTDIYNIFVNYVKTNNPYVKLSAVVGMKGLMSIFYKGFVALTGRNVKICNSREEAINAIISSKETVAV